MRDSTVASTTPGMSDRVHEKDSEQLISGWYLQPFRTVVTATTDILLRLFTFFFLSACLYLLDFSTPYVVLVILLFCTSFLSPVVCLYYLFACCYLSCVLVKSFATVSMNVPSARSTLLMNDRHCNVNIVHDCRLSWWDMIITLLTRGYYTPSLHRIESCVRENAACSCERS